MHSAFAGLIHVRLCECVLHVLPGNKKGLLDII
jgi:hypothetical protein